MEPRPRSGGMAGDLHRSDVRHLQSGTQYGLCHQLFGRHQLLSRCDLSRRDRGRSVGRSAGRSVGGRCGPARCRPADRPGTARLPALRLYGRHACERCGAGRTDGRIVPRSGLCGAGARTGGAMRRDGSIRCPTASCSRRWRPVIRGRRSTSISVRHGAVLAAAS